MKITIKDKIDLEDISDNYNYELVALLVDTDEYLNIVKKVRKSLSLPKLISYNDALLWLKRNPKADVYSEMDYEDKEIFRQKTKLSLQTSLIKQEFNIGDVFDNVIKISILAGKVTDNEWKNSALCSIYPFEYGFDIETPTVAIFLNPETSIDEITHLMRTRVKELFDELLKKRVLPIRAKENIREVRRWYWLRKTMTHTALVADLGSGYTYEAVKRAVERYRKKLLWRQH